METIQPETDYGWAPQFGVADSSWKFVSSSRDELYDLVHDVGESDNCASRCDDIAERYAAELARIRAGLPTVTAAALTLDAQTVARLSSLGYLAGGTMTKKPLVLTSGTRDTRRNVRDALSLVDEYRRIEVRKTAGVTTSNDIEIARALVARSPESVVFHHQLAFLLTNAGREREALAVCESGVVRHPADSMLLGLQGCLLARTGDEVRARNVLLQAIEAGSASTMPATLMGLADLEMCAQETARATNLYVQVVHALPRSYAAHARLAAALSVAGDFHGAARHFLRALELDGYSEAALTGLAWLMSCVPDNTRNDTTWTPLALAGRLCEVSEYRHAGHLETLAVAYASAGRFDRAGEMVAKARQVLEKTEIPAGAKEATRKRLEAWPGRFEIRECPTVSDLQGRMRQTFQRK
jgi:Flp pilus assembly protein TadD